MKYICVTNIDAVTGVICTQEPMRTGPDLPVIKGFIYNWENRSAWPVSCTPEGVYIEAPKYYGTCDDDADTSVVGFLGEFTEEEWLLLKEEEMEARKPYPSWVWDEATQSWIPPVPLPPDAIKNGGTVRYQWDEEAVNWIPVNQL